MSLLSACATAPPRVAYLGPSITTFADSLGFETETHVDPPLLTGTVKILPSKLSMKERFVTQTSEETHAAQQASDLSEAFDGWCRANGGQVQGGTGPAFEFEVASREYWRQRLVRQPKLRRQTTTSRACLDGDTRLLAAYLNIGDADIAFYDRAALAAFLGRYLADGKVQLAAQRADRAAEASAHNEQLRLRDEERRRRDPHPESEPQRVKLADAIAADVHDHGVFHVFSYVGSCVIEAGPRAEAVSVFLGKLDRPMLENVSWDDVPTVGIVFHPYITDTVTSKGAKLAITDKDAAARIVQRVEELADTCRGP